MRKETEVIIKAKTIPKKTIPQTVKKILKVICDICGKTVDLSQDNRYCSGVSRCSVCERDICRYNKPGSYSTPTCFIWDPDEPSDYRDKFCIICAPIYLIARNEMKNRHWKEEDALIARIKEQSLNHKEKSGGEK